MHMHLKSKLNKEFVGAFGKFRVFIRKQETKTSWECNLGGLQPGPACSRRILIAIPGANSRCRPSRPHPGNMGESLGSTCK